MASFRGVTVGLKIWDFVSRLFETLLFILLEKQGNIGTGPLYNCKYRVMPSVSGPTHQYLLYHLTILTPGGYREGGLISIATEGVQLKVGAQKCQSRAGTGTPDPSPGASVSLCRPRPSQGCIFTGSGGEEGGCLFYDPKWPGIHAGGHPSLVCKQGRRHGLYLVGELVGGRQGVI